MKKRFKDIQTLNKEKSDLMIAGKSVIEITERIAKRDQIFEATVSELDIDINSCKSVILDETAKLNEMILKSNLPTDPLVIQERESRKRMKE